jgi:hypothetical protein
VLNRAAADPDPAVAAGVVRIPTERLSPLAQLRLLGLIAVLLDHGDPQVRLDTLGRCRDLPLPDPDRVLLPRLLARLASPLPDECAAAARAVFATYAGATEQDAAAVGQAIAVIRDDRRVLRTTLAALQSALSGNRARLRPAVRATLDALAGDPLTARHRAGVGRRGPAVGGVAAYLSGLAAANELHPEALMAAVKAVESSSSVHRSPLEAILPMNAEDWDEASREEMIALLMAADVPEGGDIAGSRQEARNGLDVLEAALATSADERLRRLALRGRDCTGGRDGGLDARAARAAGRVPPRPCAAGGGRGTVHATAA